MEYWVGHMVNVVSALPSNGSVAEKQYLHLELLE